MPLMTKILSACSLVILLGATTALAQSPQNPLSSMVTSGWSSLKKNLSASAAKVSEADYAFKPTPQVRSFGQSSATSPTNTTPFARR